MDCTHLATSGTPTETTAADTFTSPFSFSAFLPPAKKAAQDFCPSPERSGGDKIRNRCFFCTAFWLLLPGLCFYELIDGSRQKAQQLRSNLIYSKIKSAATAFLSVLTSMKTAIALKGRE
ncbi:hypothetical protein [Nostoc sp. PCC 7524]|uniref:hypothetical protein n=1 Tax=Nostoc sp. (strain ATCC 29411 / PCC 7524) TaxID=28072 RepID=UPI001181BBCD|nr:hypothetical protein [Nostoc sp. PCC 7524]